jgi:formate hydrogenlyase subunit 6/NADH:ubiquinone oxidoreductase subunit I
MTMERELLTNVAKKPATLPYPDEKTTPVEGMRAMVTWRIERCIGCNLCVQICPPTAIHLLGKGTAAEITYHLDRCIFCGECVDVCPTHAIETTTEYELAFFDRDAMTHTFLRSPAPTPPDNETQQED